MLVETEALTDPVVVAALSSARARGVDVRVMVDPHSASSGPVLSALSAHGVLIRRGNPALSLTALSTMLIDGTTLAVSTAPFSDVARKSQRFVLVDFDSTDVQQAASVFYDDWERRSPVLVSSNVVLGPEDYAQDVVTLDIMASSITSLGVTQALVAATHRGVTVRILLDPGAPPSLIQDLQQQGMIVRLLSIGFTGSALSVDNARLLLGSATLADDALQQYRQMGLLVEDSGVSAVFASVFGYAWRAAAPIYTPTATPTVTLVPTSTITPTPTKTPIPTRTPKGYRRPTATPTPRPATPTRTPTPARPTSTPVPASTPSSLSLSVEYAPSVRIGSKQLILVHTAAGAAVSVIVTYPDGTVTNPGTKAGTADATGAFTDSWSIPLTINSGSAKALIVVTKGKLSKSAAIGFAITF